MEEESPFRDVAHSENAREIFELWCFARSLECMCEGRL